MSRLAKASSLAVWRPPAPAAETTPSRSGSDAIRVVLVTVDGVRWEDALGSRGPSLMPNLHRFVHERGTAFGGPDCEHDVRASGPNFVSLPGYLEIFSGRAGSCRDNHCAAVKADTFVDDLRADTSPEAAGPIGVFASWSVYGRAVTQEPSSVFLSAGGGRSSLKNATEDATLRSLLAAGAASTGYPGHGDYRADLHTVRAALRYLETERPRLLVVGLGDADEYAHRWNFAGYHRAIRYADEVLGRIDETLTEMGERDRTAVVVTTDHGRAHSLAGHGATYPESQRVFVAAYGPGVARHEIACAQAPMRLGHVPGLMRSLLGIAQPEDATENPLASELLVPHDAPSSVAVR